MLQAQLLAATVEAIGAVDALGVIIAAGAVLHGLQLLRALLRETATSWLQLKKWRVSSRPLLPPSEKGQVLGL